MNGCAMKKGPPMRKRITARDVAREAKEEGHSATEELKEKQKGPGNKRLVPGLRKKG